MIAKSYETRNAIKCEPECNGHTFSQVSTTDFGKYKNVFPGPTREQLEQHISD